MGNLGAAPLKAVEAVELALVAIGDAVSTADGFVLHGAESLAAFAAVGKRDLLLLQAGSAGHLAHVTVCYAIATAHRIIVEIAVELALAALT